MVTKLTLSFREFEQVTTSIRAIKHLLKIALQNKLSPTAISMGGTKFGYNGIEGRFEKAKAIYNKASPTIFIGRRRDQST
jgi:hypothetical protein